MCWSGEASTTLAIIGLATAAWSAKKKAPSVLWLTLGYFSLMELLQAFTYSVIDQCSLPSNQLLTLLGYLHIAFQPFFINALSLHFLPKEKRARLVVPVYTICFIATLVMLLQLFPFSWAGVCQPGQPLCALNLCSVSGNWHIAWNVPLNGLSFTVGSYTIGAYLAAYFVAGFIMPFIYGIWRGTIFHLLVGPGLAMLTTDNANEWPAVWCLLSIGIVMLILKVRCHPVLSQKLLGLPAPKE
jgi:hypothetical protein